MRACAILVAAALSGAPSAAPAATDRAAAEADRTSARLVLEGERPVDYWVLQTGPYIFLRFSRPFSANLEKAYGPLARYLAELRLAGGGRVLVMRLAGEPSFAHQKRGSAIVLTWIGAAAPGAVNPPSADQGPSDSDHPPARPTANVAPPPRPALPPVRIERPAAPERGADPPQTPASPRADGARLPALATVPDVQRARPEIRSAPEARPAPDAPLESPAMPAITPTLSVVNDGAETRIVVAWREPVAAAVFRHGDRIWMVFSRRAAFDLQRPLRLLGPGVEHLMHIEHDEATVLAAHARPDVRARAAHERNVWTITLKRETGVPPPEAKLAIARVSTEQAALPLPGASSPIRVVAPETGSVLYAVPSQANAAVGGGRAFVTFRLLPAVQGSAFELLADGITVGAGNGVMTIRRSGGLLMSNGEPPTSYERGQ